MVDRADTKAVGIILANLRARLVAVLLATTIALLVGGASEATAAPTVGTAQSFPVVQGLSAPLGDVTITEQSAGQLTVGDVITYRITDSAGGSTFHLSSSPAVGGTHGLSGTAAIASSSGTLKDLVVVTIDTASSGSFPGVLTLSRLSASIDAAAVTGNNIIRVSDAAGIIAAPGSPATVSNANAIGTALRATYSAISKPTLSATGFSQQAGDLTITEPAKSFFHTGDVITFSLRDSLGSADTVGLAGAPTASGGGMLVSVTGLSGGPVQPNDTGFKVTIDREDPSNGSASTMQVSNLVYNTGQAPVGGVTVSAKVTTGTATEYIYPGRVTNATVGGNTTTTSGGQPVLQLGAADQPAANLTITETPGTLKAGTTFSIASQAPGVTFASPPAASVTSGDLQLASSDATLDAGATTATWTISAPSSSASTIVLGPIYYDVAASGPTGGDAVNVLATGGVGSGFTSQTVANAMIAPAGRSLFTATSAPTTPSTAGGIVLQEVAGMQAPTGGSIVLLSPYATQISAFRTTFASVPSATVEPGSGLSLGPGNVNTSPITITTPNGPLVAPAETAAIFPVSTGSTSPARVTFANVSYALGGLVAPGGLVGSATVNSGPSGTGGSIAGNDFVNAVNLTGLGGGGGDPIYRPDGRIKLSSSATYLGDGIYNLTGSGQTASTKVRAGRAKTFSIEAQNDGNRSDRFQLVGCAGPRGFTVQYLEGAAGTTDITAAVKGGTYETLSVAGGTSTTIRAILKAKSTARSGAAGACTVTATSVTDPSKQDTVKASVKVT